MNAADEPPRSPRIRREPPRFRTVEVRRVDARSARMTRVTLAGAELEGMTVDEPAASVRLLIPSPGDDGLVMPAWNGNEFLRPDGRRPAIRTFTPVRVDADALELVIDVVLHGRGAASEWAATAAPGRPAAISGPGRGYVVPDAPAFLLGGDETAIPAITQLLEQLPRAARVRAFIEVAEPAGRLVLPSHPGATIEWCDGAEHDAPGDALVAAMRRADLDPGERVWVAGEAAAVQRIRRDLFEARGLPRAQATVRGYWKHGRAADADNA